VRPAARFEKFCIHAGTVVDEAYLIK